MALAMEVRPSVCFVYHIICVGVITWALNPSILRPLRVVMGEAGPITKPTTLPTTTTGVPEGPAGGPLPLPPLPGLRHAPRGPGPSRRRTVRGALVVWDCCVYVDWGVHTSLAYIVSHSLITPPLQINQPTTHRAIFEKGATLNPRGRHVYYIWHAWAMLGA